MPRPANKKALKAAAEYKRLAAKFKQAGWGWPSISFLARKHGIAKSSLWYALNKGKP